MKHTAILLHLALLACAAVLAEDATAPPPFSAAMLEARAKVQAAPPESPVDKAVLWLDLQRAYPLETDWMNQDAGLNECKDWFRAANNALERTLLEKAAAELGGNPDAATLLQGNPPATDPRWLDTYTRLCATRRAARLHPLLDKWPRIVFTKHYCLGGSHYAYTEDLTDTAFPERQNPNPDYRMGAALCLLEINPDGTTRIETLHAEPEGVIRDPDVSFDGKRILFSMRRDNVNDDFHLYEMDAETREIRQLTQGAGLADYEGVYLPDGNILFNSTRCVQIVDCFWTDVSNLYRCDKDGQHIHRLTFDQVHTNFPTVHDDGRVFYTRWDYNDRGQIYPQPLFQMNPDGTAQTAFYGNNSWFPTAILHARGIPGTERVVAVLSGHHCNQRGKLAILDPAPGREEAKGAQLIAPPRNTPAERIDAYGQDGEQFQYPYPLDETHYLVTYSPYGGNRQYPKPYAIYFMDIQGRRELLASDPTISCNQSIPLAPRPLPHPRPSMVDDAQTKGIYYLQDIYAGPGLAGVPRGTIKKLRVVALDYRPAGIRMNISGGEAGGALSSTPISVGNGAWDVKRVLGEVPIGDDGAAAFYVPARTPVYFQAVDNDGHVAQTMRSWSTLQPGERFSCVGCHEYKSQTPPANAAANALSPVELKPFLNVRGGFSFPKYIQPILDEKCVRCHGNRKVLQAQLDNTPPPDDLEPPFAFSLRGDATAEEKSGRLWSDAYLALTHPIKVKDHNSWQGQPNDMVNWITTQSRPDMLPPYFAGSAKSKLLELLANKHERADVSQPELDLISCWIDLGVPYCGDYTEANAWTPEERAKYDKALEKRKALRSEGE